MEERIALRNEKPKDKAMPALSPSEIVNKVADAITQSGGVSAYVSSSVRTHPRKFIFSYLGLSHSLWVYIWTITPGGRAALPNEFRIQMTSVRSPLELNPNGLTVLLGFYPDLGLFAGFDLSKHRTFTEGSPSVQIHIQALHNALQNGLSFSIKDNSEIAIGVRPDQFLIYCLNAEPLHRIGVESNTAKLLTKAAEMEPITTTEISRLTANRKQILETVSRYSRDASFRRIVLGAYDNRCAVSRSQLRLVEAAHILPVPSDASSDHVTNGIALSPTFHRAFDNCLIYLDEEYHMRLNAEKAADLIANNLDGGLPQFSDFLDKRIHLPHDPGQRPRTEFINLANRYRRIPGYI